MKIDTLLSRVQEDWLLQDRTSSKSMAGSLKHLRRLVGEQDARRFNADHVRQYTLTRKQEGAKNGTINRELAILRRGFRLASQADKLQKIPHFEMLREDNVRQGTYTRGDVERICQELPAYLVPAVWYGYFTGRRLGEIFKLRWEDVDLDRRVLTVRAGDTKTRTPDTLPIEGELYELLKQQHRMAPAGEVWVFPRQGRSLTAISHAFKAGAVRAGLPHAIFHDLRRTVSTDLSEAGVPIPVAMRVTGHKSLTTYLRYRIVGTETTRAAMAQLQEHRTGVKPRQTKGQKLNKARGLWPELP